MPVFGKRDNPQSQGGRQTPDKPWVEPLRDALQAARKDNPHVLQRATAKDLQVNLFEMIKNDRGIHAESAIAILGSLAGYACLLQAIDQKNRGMMKDPRGDFLEVGTRDGRRFYYGNLINRPLIESNLSVWSLVAGMAQHLGATKLPDVGDIAGHVARTIGAPEFGLPRIPENHRPGDLPVNYVIHLWPKLFPVLARYTDDPADLPIAIGFCLQDVMRECKDVLDPAMAASIAMEYAVPTSKIDPKLVEAQAPAGR